MVSKREKENGTGLIDIIQNAGNTDYVKGGKVYKNAPMKAVLVSSQSGLSLLDDYEPGTIAYTAGFQKMWQKSPAGTWASFKGWE